MNEILFLVVQPPYCNLHRSSTLSRSLGPVEQVSPVVTFILEPWSSSEGQSSQDLTLSSDSVQ